MAEYDWIAADWGTSHLRIWCMAGDTVADRRQSAAGMGKLDRSGFEPALKALLPDMGEAELPVMICGMAGSRQGWLEAPYLTVPCKPPTGETAVRVPCDDPRLRVLILPGLKQDSPADVMRGEETQVAGFLALNPGFDGVLCLPGTHSKWVHISAGEAVSFRTFLTGEMFALLAGQSVLRHSVGTEGWDDAAFDEAVARGLSKPALAAGDLFSLRAEALLADLSPQTARARLSGLLIGMELSASRPYWLGQQVGILGAASLAKAYQTALGAQGVPVIMTDTDLMTLEGLKAAMHAAKETI